MSFSPIAFIAPNYRDFKNDYLKAYEPGTTTPKVMALDSAGVVQVAKLQLNADGFIISAGNAIVIPYIDGAYDLWLFSTEAEADANDTSNAERLADNLSAPGSELINDLSQAYEFTTVAAYKAFTTAFPVGKTIKLLDRGAEFTVITGTGAGNDIDIIASTSVSQSIDIIAEVEFTPEQLGYDGTNAGTVINRAFNLGIHIYLKDNVSYLVETPIMLIDNATITGNAISLKSGGLIAKSDLVGNVIDTLNYDALVAGEISDTDPVSGLAAPTGYLLKSFWVRGNEDTYPVTLTQGNGMGIRIYGKQYTFRNVRVGFCANVGVLCNFISSGIYNNFEGFREAKATLIDRIAITKTGKEGFIFLGPTDSIVGNIASAENCNSFNVSNTPQTSLEMGPIFGCHGIALAATAHFGFINGFFNLNGYGVKIDNDDGNIAVLRVDADYIQADSSFGNLYIGKKVLGQIDKIQTHSIEGDGSEPHISWNSEAGITCPNVRIVSRGDEHGATGLHMGSTSTDNRINILIESRDSGLANIGHGIIMDGTYNFIEHSVGERDGTAFDTTPATGVIVRDNAAVYGLVGVAKFCNRNYDLQGAVNFDEVLQEVNIASARGIMDGIVNPKRFSDRLNQQVTMSDNDNTSVFKRNKTVATAVADSSLTTTQNFVIPHELLFTPNTEVFQTTISYNSGSFPTVVRPPYVTNVSATTVTVSVLFSGGNAGSTSINISY
jgi:hypothetical protein